MAPKLTSITVISVVLIIVLKMAPTEKSTNVPGDPLIAAVSNTATSGADHSICADPSVLKSASDKAAYSISIPARIGSMPDTLIVELSSSKDIGDIPGATLQGVHLAGATLCMADASVGFRDRHGKLQAADPISVYFRVDAGEDDHVVTVNDNAGGIKSAANWFFLQETFSGP